MDLPTLHFGRRSRRRAAIAGALAAGALIAGFTLYRLLEPVPPPPLLERSPADLLCDPSTTPPARMQAAREAAKQGVLRLALERAECVPAGRSAGLAMLAFVYEAACAGDGCLDLLLHSPREVEAQAIAKAHPGPIARALAARSCDLPTPAAEWLVRGVLGPSGAVITGAARGLLPEGAATALRRMLEAREPAAVLLLHALLTTPFCGDDRVAARQALAGLLLEALGIDEQEPYDLALALRGVPCGPLLALSQRLHLESPPRLAEAGPSLVACEGASRTLRTRALGYAGSRLSPYGGTQPAAPPPTPAHALDRKQKRRLALPQEAIAPAVALLNGGQLRAVAYTTGPGARVCGVPALAAFDEQGRLRVELDPAGVRFLDSRGQVRVRLEAQAIAFYDGKGAEALRVPAGDSQGVRLLDAAGRLRASVQWKPESIQLLLADGEQQVAQLITDQRGAQLQVGAEALEALPDGAPCRPPAAKGGESAGYALLAESGPFPLPTARALLPPLDFDDHTAAVELEESWEGPGLRLSGSGPARAVGPR